MKLIWSKKDTEYLKSNYLLFSDLELAEKLNMNVRQIANMRHRQQLVREEFSRIKYTEEEEAFIHANGNLMTDANIAEQLGGKHKAWKIRVKRISLGIKKEARHTYDQEYIAKAIYERQRRWVEENKIVHLINREIYNNQKIYEGADYIGIMAHVNEIVKKFKDYVPVL